MNKLEAGNRYSYLISSILILGFLHFFVDGIYNHFKMVCLSVRSLHFHMSLHMQFQEYVGFLLEEIDLHFC
jgi:hypothetical protein